MQLPRRHFLHVPRHEVAVFQRPASVIASAPKPATSMSGAAPSRNVWQVCCQGRSDTGTHRDVVDEAADQNPISL